jgi:NAD(P)H-nitrite reductase large subunit
MACCAHVNGDVSVSLSIERSAKPRPVARAASDEPAVRRVVVIGNGIAGVTAADYVRRRLPGCEIDVIAQELHPLYNRMGISRLVYGRSAMQGLQLLPDGWYDEHAITCWLNTQAQSIDRAECLVHLGTGEVLPFDRLILATGSAASVPEIDGVAREGVFVLRSADDALTVRAYAQRNRARKVVVAGGGLLGLEAAYAFYKLGLGVTVVHRGARPLSELLDDRAAELLARYFRALGIEIVLSAVPGAVEGNGRATGIVLEQGARLPADIVVVCAGITPNAGLAADAGLLVGRGVIVDAQMRTSDPAIFAAGDVAEYQGAITGLWPTAVQQAQVAGTNAAGDDATFVPAPSVALLKGVGLSVESIGDVQAAPGDELLVHEPESRDEMAYRKLVVRGGKLVGAILLGRPQDSAAVSDAIRSGADAGDVLARLDGAALQPPVATA